MSNGGFFQGTQAQRGYDDEEAKLSLNDTYIKRLQGLRYVPNSESSTKKNNPVVLSQSNKFKEKVEHTKKNERRKILVGDDLGQKKKKLRKFETVTKEVLRRFKDGQEGVDTTEQIDGDDLGLLINEQDWNSNKSDVIISLNCSEEDGKKRKQLILKEVLDMEDKLRDVQTDLDILKSPKVSKHEGNEKMDIDDLMKDSPFYKTNVKKDNDPKKYFNSTNEHKSQHNDDAIFTLDQARALYDTSLNVSDFGSFLKSQLSEIENNNETRVVTLSQFNRGDSVIEINDSYVDPEDGQMLVCAQGTQNDPIELEGSSKLDMGSIIEIPNTSDGDDVDDVDDKNIYLNDTIIEIFNSTDDDDDENKSNDEGDESKLIPTSSPISGTPFKNRIIDFTESPLKNIQMLKSTLVEVPSSDPASSVDLKYDEQDYDEAFVMSYNDKQFTEEYDGDEVVEIGPSQTQVDDSDDDDDESDNSGDISLEDIESLFKKWSRDQLSEQMEQWGLKPVSNKNEMVQILLKTANGIPKATLGFVLRTHKGNEIISFNNQTDGGTTSQDEDIGTKIKNELIEHLLADDEIRESLSIYTPLELDKVFDRMKDKWSGISLNKQWFCNVLDNLGVCWTPVAKIEDIEKDI